MEKLRVIVSNKKSQTPHLHPTKTLQADLSLGCRQVEDVICLADLFLHAFVFDRARRSSWNQGRRSKQFAQMVVKRQPFERHRRMRGYAVAAKTWWGGWRWWGEGKNQEMNL